MPRHNLQLEPIKKMVVHEDGFLENVTARTGEQAALIKNPVMSKGGKLPNWHATAHELAAQYLADMKPLTKRLTEYEQAYEKVCRTLSDVYSERDEAHRLLRLAKRSPWWWLMPADIKARARELGL